MMGFSIALTASSQYEMLLTGSAVTGVGALVYLVGNQLTERGFSIMDTMEKSEIKILKHSAKFVGAIVLLGELLKFTS